MARDVILAAEVSSLPVQPHLLPSRDRRGCDGGSGAAYLHQTVSKLEEAGIHDSYLWELQHLVAAEIAKMFPDLTAASGE